MASYRSEYAISARKRQGRKKRDKLRGNREAKQKIARMKILSEEQFHQGIVLLDCFFWGGLFLKTSIAEISKASKTNLFIVDSTFIHAVLSSRFLFC